MFEGVVFLSAVIYIPQKLQIVNGDTPFKSGYRLLALTVASSIGAAMAVFQRENRHIASFYVFLVAGVLQIVSLALLGSLSSSSRDLPPAFYGYEVLMGLGLRLSLALSIKLVPHVFEPRDVGEDCIASVVVGNSFCDDYASDWNGRCAAVSMVRRIDRSLNLRQDHQP